MGIYFDMKSFKKIVVFIFLIYLHSEYQIYGWTYIDIIHSHANKYIYIYIYIYLKSHNPEKMAHSNDIFIRAITLKML